jgi:hypothetical protein
MEQLLKISKRDNAILIGEYPILETGTLINFTCKCNKETCKKIREIRVSGLFCSSCLDTKKGFYKNHHDQDPTCSVCGTKPYCYDEIISDNWETCSGRNMFFCPNHRVQYPCHNEECDADECYNFRENINWKNMIKYWDYDNERYN